MYPAPQNWLKWAPVLAKLLLNIQVNLILEKNVHFWLENEIDKSKMKSYLVHKFTKNDAQN